MLLVNLPVTSMPPRRPRKCSKSLNRMMPRNSVTVNLLELKRGKHYSLPEGFPGDTSSVCTVFVEADIIFKENNPIYPTLTTYCIH